jgi:hypothetical protein
MLNVANCKLKQRLLPYHTAIVSLYKGSLHSMQFEHSDCSPLALDLIQNIP